MYDVKRLRAIGKLLQAEFLPDAITATLLSKTATLIFGAASEIDRLRAVVTQVVTQFGKLTANGGCCPLCEMWPDDPHHDTTEVPRAIDKLKADVDRLRAVVTPIEKLTANGAASVLLYEVAGADASAK